MMRGFKGVWIPRDIWLREDLSCVDKCLLAEIDSLAGYKQGCFAGNSHLATFLHVSVPTVTRSVKKLTDLGLLKVEVEKTKTGTKRTMYPLIKMIRPPNQIDDPPTNQNDEHSNTGNISNTESNTPPTPSKSPDELALDIDSAVVEGSGEAFKLFYDAYPRHEGKADAEKAWKQTVKKSGFPHLLDLIGIVEARKRGEWSGKEKQFIPLPASYLRGKRWEDEIAGTTVSEDERVSRLLEESKRGY